MCCGLTKLKGTFAKLKAFLSRYDVFGVGLLENSLGCDWNGKERK